MKNVFVETSRVQAFLEAASVVADTEKGQPGFLVLWSEAGRGKTITAKQYAVRNENSVYVRVHEGWTPMAMLSKILKGLNGMSLNRTEKTKLAIMEVLDSSGQILLIDEADRLDIRNIEHLRDIHDETGAPMILIGEPSLYAKLKARSRIWQRVTRVVDFGPVERVDVVMFGAKACGLKIEAPAADRVIRLCKGSFRLLYHIMVELERVARVNKIDVITREIVDQVPDRRPAPVPERIGR